jgi:hypothetical protein
MSQSGKKEYLSDKMVQLFQIILRNTAASLENFSLHGSPFRYKNLEIMSLLLSDESDYKLDVEATFIPNNVCLLFSEFVDRKSTKNPGTYIFDTNIVLNIESQLTALFLLVIFYFSGNMLSKKLQQKKNSGRIFATKTKRTPQHKLEDDPKMRLFYNLFRDVLELYYISTNPNPNREQIVLSNFVCDLNLFLDTHSKRKMLAQLTKEMNKKMKTNQNKINKHISDIQQKEQPKKNHCYYPSNIHTHTIRKKRNQSNSIFLQRPILFTGTLETTPEQHRNHYQTVDPSPPNPSPPNAPNNRDHYQTVDPSPPNPSPPNAPNNRNHYQTVDPSPPNSTDLFSKSHSLQINNNNPTKRPKISSIPNNQSHIYNNNRSTITFNQSNISSTFIPFNSEPNHLENLYRLLYDDDFRRRN